MYKATLGYTLKPAFDSIVDVDTTDPAAQYSVLLHYSDNKCINMKIHE